MTQGFTVHRAYDFGTTYEVQLFPNRTLPAHPHTLGSLTGQRKCGAGDEQPQGCPPAAGLMPGLASSAQAPPVTLNWGLSFRCGTAESPYPAASLHTNFRAALSEILSPLTDIVKTDKKRYSGRLKCRN